MSDSKEEKDAAEGYKVADNAIKKVDDIMKRDQEDESLNKWKEALLGKALSENISPKDDPRRVVISELTIICEGRPDGDIVYKFENKEQLAKMKDTPFVLKEGCRYKVQIRFRVQHELVTGLKYLNTAYRKGIKVGKEETMIGSYAPQAVPHVVTIPDKGQWDEAPKGLIARGKYKANCKFIDDDGVCHLEYDYYFSLKKDWASNEKDEDE